MKKIVLIRHGESVWNKENRFAGWVDVDLTDKGVTEAHKAGLKLKEAGYRFDLAFTSLLKRANRTLSIILDELGSSDIEIRKSWRLNERHYGALQGLNKSEMAEKYGEEQVFKWRRGYDTPIPPLSKDSPMYPGNDPMYADLPKSDMPLSENLKMVVERVVPYWKSDIVPAINLGRNIIIAASGNSLRALLKHIAGMSEEEIVEFNFPTSIALICELNDDLSLNRKYFLADEAELSAAIATVVNQGKAK